MAIEVKNLTHIYNKGMPDEHKAISGVSFNVKDGEILGIIGHTGSGKSTLLQHLNGLLKADEGQISIDGVEITNKNVPLVNIRKKVGLVFQYPEYQLFEDTVEKDVAFGPKNLGLSEDDIKKRVCKALELVGLNLEEYGEKSPFELSGGQKRRVAIAGILAMEPSVLILDEPAAGLDPKSHDEIIKLIKKVNKDEHTIIIFVSHDMDEIEDLADKVIVMNKGKIIMSDTPHNIFAKRDELREISLGVPSITEFIDLLRGYGVPIEKDIFELEAAEEEIYKYLKEKTKGGIHD